MKQFLGVVVMLLLGVGCATSGKIHESFAKATEQALRHNLPVVFMPHGRKPNFAGGVTVDIDFQNVSGKTMRRIAFTVIPYDEKGDQITSEVNNRSEVELATEGYFRSDSGYYSRSWDNVWYSTAIKYIAVKAVAITYLDDTTQVINNPDDLYKMAIHADTKSYVYWWSGYPIGSKPAQELNPAESAPLRSEPIQQ